MNKIIGFLKDVRAELARVSWPTSRQTIQYTGVVVIMSILVAVFLGAWDAIFGYVLNKILLR